jgi:hypothetical protein
MKQFILPLLICTMLHFIPCELSAQSRSVTLGKDFYLAFGANVESTNIYLKLKVVTAQTTNVTVYYYYDGTSTTHTFFNKSVNDIDISENRNKVFPDVLESRERKAIRVTADHDIALYALNQAPNSAEATAILPVQSLGSNYKGISYKSQSSMISVVAIEDNTDVNVDGTPLAPLLNEGYVSMHIKTELTNMDISVDKDTVVAVFASSSAAKIPSTALDADNLYEQLWPVHSLGKSYIVPVTHRKYELVRILAKEATDVVITGGFVGTKTLTAGEMYEFYINEVTQIEANKPISVNSFMVGNKFNDIASFSQSMKNGDPAQCWINPNEQMTAYTMIAPFYMPNDQSSINKHNMIIVTRDKYKHHTTLKRNGYISSLTFTNPPGIPDYAVAIVSMLNNNSYVYEVENVYGFNAYVYGYADGIAPNNAESYHFAAGAMVWDLNAYFTVDTIHHLATSPVTNSYPTSGSASIFRNIEGSYTDVKWFINGQDVSSLINDPATGVEYNFILPTDTAELSGYNLRIGVDTIMMRVYRNATDYNDYIGRIWILPPPDPQPDCGFIYGNPGGGGGGGSVTINIIENDCNIKPGDQIQIKDPPNHGTVTLITNSSDTSLIYTPDTDFKGVDTIKYCVTSEQFNEEICTDVYVVVVFPVVDRYEACPGVQLAIGLEATPGIIFDWYDGPTLIKTASDTVWVTSVASDKTFHAKPRFAATGAAVGDISIPVTVYTKTTGCGSTTEEMCDGSILFYEDFSGNDVADAGFADTPLSGKYRIPYAFVQTELSAADPKKYAVAKAHASLDDHTYPSDSDKGRMLTVSGGNTQDTVLQIPVGDLCANMEYSFSAWILNLSPGSSLTPNFSFVLIDTVQDKIKYTFSATLSGSTWEQYGFNYNPSSSLNNLKLLIVNYATGTGDGNLFAIDDVKIALCVPKATATITEDVVCTKENAYFSGNFSGDVYDLGGGYYSYVSYLWQFSPDDKNWTNISDATSSDYTLYNAKTVNSGYYRMVAGANNSINSPNCVVYSNSVYLQVNPCFTLQNDTSSTFKNTPVTVPVLNNDVYPCESPALGIVSTTANGQAVFSGNQIVYTPQNDFTGLDTVRYSVECDGTTQEAYLFVVVTDTGEPSYSACPGVVIPLSMISIDDVSYDWYASLYDSYPVSEGASTDSITITVPDYTTYYYVQPYYNGTIAGNRIAITVSILTSCGSSNDEACEGTVIFKEDFGGNSINDPSAGSQIATPSTTGFTYKPDNNISTGEYSVSKYLDYNYTNSWNATNDHTHENTSERGYFMFANADNTGLTYYERTVDLDLCSDVELSVNAWFKNVGMYGQSPNVRFVITDNLGNTLTDYQTGNITGDAWKQYGVTLNIPQSTTQIKLSLSNAVTSSNYGNDIAIDDIDVRICSDAAISVPQVNGICEGSDYTFNPAYTLSKLESLYAGEVIFKWQHSVTGNINNPSDWTDIAGATSPTYAITGANTSHNGYYRLLAGDEDVIDKPDCRTASNPVELEILLLPTPVITGNAITCNDESASVSVSGGVSYYWYHNGSTSPNITYTPTGNTELIVQVTGSNGCSVNDTFNIEYVAALDLTLTDDAVICEGESIQLTAFSNGADISYQWSTGETSSTITVAPGSSQYYEVEVSNSKNCMTTGSVHVEVSESPIITIAGESDICINDTVQLTASGGLTYEWSTNETESNIIVSPQVPTTYTVTGKNEHGCPTTASHEITNVRALPSPLITGAPEICYGEIVTLTASGGVAYEWLHDLSTSDAVVVSPETDTEYTVTVTGSNGCSAAASMTVSVNGLPAFSAKEDTVICSGSSIVLQTSGNATDGFSYLWSTGETTAAITVAPNASQYYYVEIGNPKNCTTKDSIHVEVIDLPVVAIAGESDICLNDIVQLTASGANSYEWNTNETGDNISVSPQTPTTYTVTGKNEHGCPATVSHSITNVRALPDPSITGISEICYGDNIVLTASGGVAYIWEHDLSTLSEIAVSPTADMEYKVAVTGSNGCSADASLSVKVNDLPELTVSADTSICAGNSVTLTAQSDKQLVYNWNTGAQTSSITVSPTVSEIYKIEAVDSKQCVTQASISVEVNSLPDLTITGQSDICFGDSVKLTASGANTYQWSTDKTGDSIFVSPEWATTYSVTGTDSHGCQATTSFEIANIKPLPVPVITGKQEICYGESIVLKASGGSVYKWAHNSSPIDSVTVTPTKDSTFAVTVTGANGCSAGVSLSVKVNSLPELTPISDTIICTGQSLILQAESSGMGLTYLWSSGERSSVIELNPSESQNVWVEVSNPKKCSVKDDIAIEVMPPPVLNIVGQREICIGSELTLTAYGATSYIWNTGFEGSVYTTKPVDDNEYKVTGTDEYGCKATATAAITILSKPEVAISVNPKVISDRSSDVQFETVTTIEDYDVIWDFGDNTWSTFASGSHHYYISGSDSLYNVVFSITDSNGCVDTIRETVYVDLFVPTLFFPSLGQVFMRNCESCNRIEVFDRLGVRLYDGPTGWDGIYNGRIVDPDTYFYVITLNFNIFGTNVRKGYITVGREHK